MTHSYPSSSSHLEGDADSGLPARGKHARAFSVGVIMAASLVGPVAPRVRLGVSIMGILYVLVSIWAQVGQIGEGQEGWIVGITAAVQLLIIWSLVGVYQEADFEEVQ